MPITIGTNIASLNAQRKLGQATDRLESTFERLSSGQRINRASDDAAGLAIASSLKKDTRVYGQAIRNVNDGVSALSIAEGALKELSGIVIRQQELAEQSANGVYSSPQRSALNNEAAALTNEYNRIIRTTVFNGVNLLESSDTSIRVQAGYGLDGSLSMTLGAQLGRAVGDGTFQARVTFPSGGAAPSVSAVGDYNGDGNIDLAIGNTTGPISIMLGRGDGTFNTATTYGPFAMTASFQTLDLNNDGKLDLIGGGGDTENIGVFLGNGDGSFKAKVRYDTEGTFHVTSASYGDVNGDGLIDVVATDGINTSASVLLGNGDGSFKARSTFLLEGGGAYIALGDLNGDGALDLVSDRTVYTSIRLGNGDGTFRAVTSFLDIGNEGPQVFDFNGDGHLDIFTRNTGGSSIHVSLGVGNGTFGAVRSYMTPAGPQNNMVVRDFTGDDINDVIVVSSGSSVISLLAGNSNGTFKAAVSYDAGGYYGLSAGDFNSDGALDVVVAHLATSILFGNTRKVATAASLDLTTQASSRAALTATTDALNRINKELGNIGAIQSRLAVAANVLSVSRENFSSANSRISDADIAVEGAELVRSQILQKAGASILANANQQPALALQLIKV